MSISNSENPDCLSVPLRSDHDRRIIFCISVALVLIALVVLVRPLRQQGIRESLFWYLKMQPASKCDVVVAGDSRILQGVDPVSMKEVIGGSIEIVNVGFRSGALEREYVGFASSLLKEDSKKVLLLGITANAFTPRSLTDNGFLEQKKLGTKRPYTLPASCVWLERKFQPFAIREILSLVRGRIRAGNYETFHDTGWLEADLIPRNAEGAFALYRRRFDGNQVSQTAIENLIEQVKELVQSGTRIVGFEPPVPAQMQSIEDEHSGFDRGEFQKMFRSAGGVWLEFESSRYVTVDGSHLAPESAKLLSKDLAAEVWHVLGWKEEVR